MSDDYSRRIRDLDFEVDSLKDDVSSLHRKLGDVDELDYELQRLRESISTVEDTAEEVGSDLRDHIKDTDQAVKRLTGRIQALEAHLRAAAGIPEADLDTTTPEQRKLAQAAERGRQARAALLDDWHRQTHRNTVQHYNGTLGKLKEHQNKVIAAAGILAGTPRTARGHQQAATDFAAALGLERSCRAQLPRLAAEAGKAQEALAQDAATREGKQGILNAGEKAEKKLDWILRSRLADAVRDRALLPVWFVTVLGPVPPAEQTQEWMDLATRVLAYRLTYEVTDAVVALGPPPAPHLARRIAWYRELNQALGRW